MLLLVAIGPLKSQERSSEEITHMIFMDSVVVRASRTGFSVSDFIDLVRKDLTFYSAFRNLRMGSFELSTDMKFFNKVGEVQADYEGRDQQVMRDTCLYQRRMKRVTSGDFFRKRNGEPRYYTFTLFDRLFLIHDTICGVEEDLGPVDFDRDEASGHVVELKKLIFAPGSKSDVPFIGSKTAIFSDKMIDNYDFSIRSERFRDGTEAFVFEAKVKPEFGDTKDNTTVIKQLTTYFAKSDFQVLGRTYRLAQYKAIFQFDVFMDIVLDKTQARYYPSKIHFDGFWNVPMKRKETSTFTLNIDHYEHYN